MTAYRQPARAGPTERHAPSSPRRHGRRRLPAAPGAHRHPSHERTGTGTAAATPDGQAAAVGARGRRCVVLEVRPAEQPLSAEELRRREEELERLIVKAACLRAARLAEQNATGHVRVDAPARRRR